MRSSKQEDPQTGTSSSNPKQKKKEEDSLLESSLRSELVSDQTGFDIRSSRLGWLLNPRTWIILILVLAIIGCGWVFYAGPGRPSLENLLVSLAQRQPEPTETSTPSPTVPTETPTATPSATPTKRPTPTPTATQQAPLETETQFPSETLNPEGADQGSIAGCIPAEAITLADLGEELCVTGNVVRTEKQPAGFLIIMVDKPASFYFLSYDRTWDDLKAGTCVMATGEIHQLRSNPVMIVGYTNGLEDCP